MKPEEENQSVWNPEEAYRTSRAGGIRLLLLILAIAAAGALFIFRQAGQPADDLVLEASTTFEEADEILREAGWKPQGEIHRNGNETVRFYEGVCSAASRYTPSCRRGTRTVRGNSAWDTFLRKVKRAARRIPGKFSCGCGKA